MFSRLIWTRRQPNIQMATKERAFSTNSASAFATFRVWKPQVGYFTCRWLVAGWGSSSARDYRRGEERSPDGPDAATRAGNLRAPLTEPLVLRTESGRPHESQARESHPDGAQCRARVG